MDLASPLSSLYTKSQGVIFRLALMYVKWDWVLYLGYINHAFPNRIESASAYNQLVNYYNKENKQITEQVFTVRWSRSAWEIRVMLEYKVNVRYEEVTVSMRDQCLLSWQSYTWQEKQVSTKEHWGETGTRRSIPLVILWRVLQQTIAQRECIGSSNAINYATWDRWRLCTRRVLHRRPGKDSECASRYTNSITRLMS